MSHPEQPHTFREFDPRGANGVAYCGQCGPRWRRVRGRMAMLRNGGTRGQTRSSALWGTGSRDDSRSNALWGKGGRGLVTMMAAVLVLGIPLAASAGGNGGSSEPTYMSPGMLQQANKHPDKFIHVIVTANGGSLPKSQILANTLGKVDRKLDLINGIS